MVDFGNDWNDVLKLELKKDYYTILRGFLKHEYAEEKVYPNMNDIFNAFKSTSFADTKVVIIGQDPYHSFGQAHGLAFSVKQGVRVPPSLKNIYKELVTDVGIQMPDNGYLMPWAKQGVLMLNTILTVREGRPLSHKGYGWEQFTDAVLKKLNSRKDPIVFLVWGAPAKKKMALITNSIHKKFESAHPSPLSAYYGFFGCKHFSQANEQLAKWGKEPIDWQI